MNRLGEFIGVAGKLRELVADLRDQFIFGQMRVRPLILRLEHDESVGQIGRHGIGRHFRRAGFRKHIGDLREGAHNIFDLKLHRLGLSQRCAWNAVRLHGDIFFIQRRDEFLAEAGINQRSEREGADADGHHLARLFHRPRQHRLVNMFQAAHEGVFALLAMTGDKERNHRREKCQRQQKFR